MAQWIEQLAAAFDARPALHGPLRGAVLGAPSSSVCGFQEVIDAAQVGEASAQALLGDLHALGAVAVTELARDDWVKLASWSQLLPLEQRRLHRALDGTAP